MLKGNLHTHTTFCDGKNTPETIVFKALELGFDEIGFSGHSPLDGCDNWCMNGEREKLYRAEIERLKEKYDGQIVVRCGVEQDFFSPPPKEKYDYAIGSVHCIKLNGTLLPVDTSRENLRRIVDDFFGGDFMKMAREYFRLVSEVVERTGADIIGHFDLITKFNKLGAFFDEENPEYLEAGFAAIDKLLDYRVPFELNTGAIARGHLDRAYPAPIFIDYIHSRGGKLILTSDCHDLNFLDCAFSRYLPEADAMTLTDLNR